MKLKKKRTFIIITIPLVASIVCLMLLNFNSDDRAVTYRTEKITRGNIMQVVNANGTLNPIQMVNVGTQVSGAVKELYVKVNDTVKKDQLLAVIDPKLIQAALKQSRSNMEVAKINFDQAARDLERTKTLVAKEYSAKVDLERSTQSYLSSRNYYESAKAQVERDETNLDYTQIKSPIDGVVISQEITMGQTVTASFQTPNLFKIAGSLKEMKIDVNLSESDIGKVKVDMPVAFSVDAFPGKQFAGKIDAVNLNPKVDGGVVTYLVTVKVSNIDSSLFPGMTAYVSIVLSEKKDVLRVPAAALRYAPPAQKVSAFRRVLDPAGAKLAQGSMQAGDGIYVLKDGEPERVAVETGVTDETFVEVKGRDIKEGDTVITGVKIIRND